MNLPAELREEIERVIDQTRFGWSTADAVMALLEKHTEQVGYMDGEWPENTFHTDSEWPLQGPSWRPVWVFSQGEPTDGS